ncbi:glycosyltransferase [Flavobacterium sp. 316]|uniref:TIGR04282 family arsenosugar biosynthesis glycosyltransferase n=1 Tax=Flavobacterium sediminilitoris TaxID=2024526 RepID=A0ABY4HNS2_9FLAO|nr:MULTISPECIES: TIGR04282 family arsenosugar biosynthesis glycosyltransferase [Flavobacterium]KIX21537.1 glycosyltransferase [Flavobacterium sp. 316]UOX34281.1 TIGR04282 family arsenosugar biosynthesis glycosyltransferase [Flavobacterium sediminilitoris]
MKNLILIFTRNPEIGKVKTRLAASIGNEKALEIYIQLLEHTKKVALETNFDKRVLYSEKINTNDIWENKHFQKKVQHGNDLGERMQNAFKEGFQEGYEKIVIIGSDLIELESKDIDQAFKILTNNDLVIGPAKDGGYYLLGMKQIPDNIFQHKNWGTNTVLKDTLKDIEKLKYQLLNEKNDIDTIEDIKNIQLFEKYL